VKVEVSQRTYRLIGFSMNRPSCMYVHGAGQEIINFDAMV